MKVKDPYTIAIGKAIREKRIGKGWTQAELAEKSFLSANFVARLERSELQPSLLTADKLTQALGCTLDSLVSECPDIYQ